MGDILPQRSSPLRSIVMVPYQKGKQSLKAAVSILKMIRLPPLLSYKPSKVEVDPRKRHKRLPANLIVGNDYWWFLFGNIPYLCAWVSIGLFDKDPNPVIYAFVFWGLLFFHIVALHSVVYWHREMSPFRLIGAKAKFMIEVIPVIVAAALRHLLEFDGAYYALLLSCTTYFYTFAHFMHAAYDIAFSTTIGQGGFGTVYKAEFKDGSVVAVKRMNKVSEQAEDEFCREIELLARLHHRHLVALKGFCTERHERFLMYEYMPNGSLKDQLHNPGTTPLSWCTRIQIAIDVANALEYLHFYCDPPLCHRDIKSSNILLDENFVAKVADFGLAHASKDGSICFEPVNTDIKGTAGYMDPEYVITQELTEKSDVYSYGVVLLELITARRAVQENKNLIEWVEIFLTSESRITELVDPNIGDSYDFDQLETLLAIVRWCTQREGRARPSIKQVLRLLYECAEPMHSGFVESMEDEDYDDIEGRGRTSRSRLQKGEGGDGRCLASSSSTSRSYCSRSFLIETSPPQSPL